MKRAVVTGASSGIGREAARLLADQGWRVLAVARRRDRLAELEAQSQGNILAFEADMSRPDSPQRVIDAAAERLGGLDLLVNNAGCSWVGPFENIPTDQLDKILNLNVRSLMLTCRHAIPLLEKSDRAQIINIGSVAAHLSMPTIAVYCASKAAVVMFSQVLGRELAEKKIRVNVLSPAGTDTEMFSTVGVKIDPAGLVPAADMAALIPLMADLPPGVDLGEVLTQKRCTPWR